MTLERFSGSTIPDTKENRESPQVANAGIGGGDKSELGNRIRAQGGSQAARQQQLAQLNQERKSRAAAPWRGLDKKIPVAQQQIEQFYRDRFPAEDSTISADLGKVAQDTGVRVSSVKYKTEEAEIEGLEK